MERMMRLFNNAKSVVTTSAKRQLSTSNTNIKIGRNKYKEPISNANPNPPVAQPQQQYPVQHQQPMQQQPLIEKSPILSMLVLGFGISFGIGFIRLIFAEGKTHQLENTSTIMDDNITSKDDEE
jgi:hypothetical protein